MSPPTDKPKIRSKGQQQLLVLVEKGLSNDQIAEALDRSPFTIKVTLQRIFKTLGVHNRTAAVNVWRADVRAAGLTIETLRQSRRENEANIQALQELVKLQTTAIELMLQQR